MVLVEHVEAALAELTPPPLTDAAVKVISDYSKRVAFLFIGFSVVQGSHVFNQDPISKGSVAWLVGDVVVAMLLFGASVIMDFSPLRKYLSQRKSAV